MEALWRCSSSRRRRRGAIAGLARLDRIGIGTRTRSRGRRASKGRRSGPRQGRLGVGMRGKRTRLPPLLAAGEPSTKQAR